MDFLKGGIETLKLKRANSSGRSSRLIGAGYKPKSGRDVYYMYKDEFGFVPENPSHLITFAKQKKYNLKYKNAEALLNNPPPPPKKKLATGGFLWSDVDDDELDSSDSLSEDDDFEDIKQEQSKQSSSKQTTIALSSDYDQLKSPQIVNVRPLSQLPKLSQTYSTAISAVKEEMNADNGVILKDNKSGYSIYPLTASIIIEFALDLSLKQWGKDSKNFIVAIGDSFSVKRSDFNILTVSKYQNNQIKVSILFRKLNPKWPNYDENADAFKKKLDEALNPLKKTFKDSGHLLKMLKRLQFGEIDKAGNNQVSKEEFDTYFREHSVEPIHAQVLQNLFNTLDADGDGEITLMEFFKWKSSFNQNRLTSMFPIISYDIIQSKHLFDAKMKAAVFAVRNHFNMSLQHFPFEMDLKHLYCVENKKKSEKFESFSNNESSKLLYLVHKNGISDLDVNILLHSIGKKGEHFNEKGMYGNGYYLTSNLEYALADIFHRATSDVNKMETGSNHLSAFQPLPDVERSSSLRGFHKVQISNSEHNKAMRSKDFSHNEYSLIVCRVNPGTINYLNDYSRGKKIKSSFDSNYVQNIIADFNHELFGAPESQYNALQNEQYDGQYYEGNLNDCYIVKNHERIMPKMVLTFKRASIAYIFCTVEYGDSLQKIFQTRKTMNQYLPNVIYGGEKIDKVIKLVRLKMQFQNIFLFRFVGLDVNVNKQMIAFSKYIRGNIQNVKVKMYPITILYDIRTKKQLWNMIVPNNEDRTCSNVKGSASKIFSFIKTNKRIHKAPKEGESTVCVFVMSIKFVKSRKKIQGYVKEQMRDAKSVQGEYEYVDDSDDDYKYDYDDESLQTETNTNRKPLRIQITNSEGGTMTATKSPSMTKKISLKRANSEEKIKRMLDEEALDKLLEMKLPNQVYEYLGSPKDFQIPEADSEDRENLERDLRKLSHGLYNQSANQRKFSKLAILKWYSCLVAIYKRYRKLGGDSFWLTLSGFNWLLQDAKIPNKSSCTLEECEQLFEITYKMHHKLQTRKRSIHQIQASVDEDFGKDDDPWSGIFKDNATETFYKLSKIGDQRLSGGVAKSAQITGIIDSLNHRKATLEIKYFQRRRAGHKRIWNAQLIAPNENEENIKMPVEWKEVNTNLKLSKHQTGKLELHKISGLKDSDGLSRKQNKFFGLSQFEFIDLILSISTTKYGEKCDYQFECVDKLMITHFEDIYQNIVCNELNAISKNEHNKKQMQDHSACLRKLFKIYASLDDDDAANDNGLGEDEWSAFALSLCKSLKNTNKKIWKNGGKPSFEEIRACFILAKPQNALDSDEIDFIRFQKALINFTNVMFKISSNSKYEIVSFSDKLKTVLKECEKMNLNASKSLTAQFKKAKTMRASTKIGTPTIGNNQHTEFPKFSEMN